MTNKDYLELLASKMYIEMLKNNISRSLEYKRSQGQYTEFAPIGYQNIRDKKMDLILLLIPSKLQLL